MDAHLQEPGQRIAQKALAEWTTRFLHGEAGLDKALAATAALFSGEVSNLDAQVLNEAFATVPSTKYLLPGHPAGSVDLVDLLATTSLAKSKREAREFLSNGAISVNGEKASLETRITAANLLHDEVVLLRRGRKHWHLVRFVRSSLGVEPGFPAPR